MARVFAAITPLTGQLLLDDTSALATFLLYSATGFAGVVAAALLPYETLGRDADNLRPDGSRVTQTPNQHAAGPIATEKSPLVLSTAALRNTAKA